VVGSCKRFGDSRALIRLTMNVGQLPMQMQMPVMGNGVPFHMTPHGALPVQVL
jgi:hypothetical protein